ncbi:MAG TPA: peptidogalycan biosysnthesis protein, partial [Steroidobacter sp.]|nr:peptidogalycan biosysnthesis protein [Steroidobacter sp.]
MAATLQARIITSIDRIPAAQWNALALGGNPFVRHEFLLALERAGCVGKAAGWLPHHLLLEDRGQLVAAMPLYRKSHSWGEFVFDWSWARAYDE